MNIENLKPITFTVGCARCGKVAKERIEPNIYGQYTTQDIQCPKCRGRMYIQIK